MRRVTKKDLENMVRHINEATGNPIEAYTRQEDGRHKANIGNYHLSWAYGGVCLEQMSNEGGGVRTVLWTGYTTKGRLMEAMQAYLAGIDAGRK